MHACEGETSMMMAAHPGLVRAEHLAEAHGPRITLPAESTEPVYMAVPFDRITESGVAGDGRVATREKGETMLAGCARRWPTHRPRSVGERGGRARNTGLTAPSVRPGRALSFPAPPRPRPADAARGTPRRPSRLDR